MQMNPFIYFCLYQKDNCDLQAKYNLSVFNILGYLDQHMPAEFTPNTTSLYLTN